MSTDFAEPGSLEPSSVAENVAIAEFDDFAKYITDVVNVLLPADDAGGPSNFNSIVNDPQCRVSSCYNTCSNGINNDVSHLLYYFLGNCAKIPF